MIEKILIDNYKHKIASYFNSDSWERTYKEKIKQIYHDEPWLTLISCYSIFGNLAKIEKKNLDALNYVLNTSGVKTKFNFTSITKIKVEEKLPEILDYRNYLKGLLKKENFHLYPDVIKTINEKLRKKDPSFEGNTNLDLLIEGVSNGKKTTLFIEAKFMSDISYKITYNPVRDQIIRNIDCGIDYIKSNGLEFENFFFMLLTPKIFRTNKYGGSKSSELKNFGTESSRLYCYKMDEYKDYAKVKKELPHRVGKLKPNQLRSISKNIGWITFEDFIKSSKKYKIIDNSEEENTINKFFEERNLI